MLWLLLFGCLFYVVCAMNHIKHFQSPQKHFFFCVAPLPLSPAWRINNNGGIGLCHNRRKQEKSSFPPSRARISRERLSMFEALFSSHLHPHCLMKDGKSQSRLFEVSDAFSQHGKRKKPFSVDNCRFSFSWWENRKHAKSFKHQANFSS